jgi:hypothetical protein
MPAHEQTSLFPGIGKKKNSPQKQQTKRRQPLQSDKGHHQNNYLFSHKIGSKEIKPTLTMSIQHFIIGPSPYIQERKDRKIRKDEERLTVCTVMYLLKVSGSNQNTKIRCVAVELLQ